MDVCVQGKTIDCIRDDGGADEGPSHLEVQFRWIEWHLIEEKELTLVTTRNSGASCFNFVELQNGIVGRAHANLFIPSTLCGSAETQSGRISQERFQENMEAALQVYLDRVNEIPFGSSVIKMYRGATDQRAAQMKQERTDLLVFPRGTKSAKKELKEKPNHYHHFEEIWSIRERHMVKNSPSEYVFVLRACYEAECNHPICHIGRPTDELVWYTGGPSVQFLFLPVPDPERPWGSKECKNCNGFCTGHFMCLEKVLATDSNDLLAAHTYPPSKPF